MQSAHPTPEFSPKKRSYPTFVRRNRPRHVPPRRRPWRASVPSAPGAAAGRCQTACKPGSVPPRRPSGLGAVMAIPLGRSLPSASCDRPERRRGGPPGIPRTRCLPLLLGLAPGGVFPAAAVAGGAVRSYRTVSPLPPARRAEAGRRCTFCGTFPGVAPAGRYPAPYLRGARTFLSPHDGGERPSGRLATKIWAVRCLSKPRPPRLHGILWLPPQPREAGRLCRRGALL